MHAKLFMIPTETVSIAGKLADVLGGTQYLEEAQGSRIGRSTILGIGRVEVGQVEHKET